MPIFPMSCMMPAIRIRAMSSELKCILAALAALISPTFCECSSSRRDYQSMSLGVLQDAFISVTAVKVGFQDETLVAERAIAHRRHVVKVEMVAFLLCRNFSARRIRSMACSALAWMLSINFLLFDIQIMTGFGFDLPYGHSMKQRFVTARWGMKRKNVFLCHGNHIISSS